MGHRQARRTRDRNFEKTVIKTGLRTFCKEDRLIPLIERAVEVCSQVSWETSLLATFHVIRCLERDITLAPLDQNFWNNCVSAIANGRKGPPSTASQELKDSYTEYAALRPGNYARRY